MAPFSFGTSEDKTDLDSGRTQLGPLFGDRGLTVSGVFSEVDDSGRILEGTKETFTATQSKEPGVVKRTSIDAPARFSEG